MLTIWLEPGQAEHWLPAPGDGYTVQVNGGELLRAVVTAARPGDGGLWLDLAVEGPYA